VILSRNHEIAAMKIKGMDIGQTRVSVLGALQENQR
jgi:hypothetical protein